MINLDHAIIHLVNNAWRNPLFDQVMPVITTFGDWNVLIAIAIALLFIRNRDVRTLGILLLGALWLADAVGPALKFMFARPRPFVIYPDIKALVHASGYSLPSGHAVNAFTAASLLCVFLKRHYVLYFFAFLVAFSRVYLGVHFPSDVLAGALVGIAIGWSTYGLYHLIDLIMDRLRRKAQGPHHP
jgi:undecaprenyl-diphosphatase